MDDKGLVTEQPTKPKISFLNRMASARPVRLLGAGILVFLGVSFEYAYSKVLDRFWEPETPAEIIKLNEDLQSSTSKLNDTSLELKTLVARIDRNSIDDPELQSQLNELTERLSNFSGLLDTTSSSTAKVATLSKALEEDLRRIKSMSDGSTNGTPNLILSIGQAVQVCDSLASFGFKSTYKNGARTSISGSSTTFGPGDRKNFTKGSDSYVDFLGLDGERAKFSVTCR
ncbi:MAG: hypothetical protein ABJN62_15660 [Halioglobus sp.]